MDIDEVCQFIKSNHRAVLATTRRDGGVQLSPIAVTVDDDGSLIISSSETTSKAANLRRDPKAYLCIMNNGFFGQWAQAEGTVTIESLPGAMEGLVRYYRSISGEHPDWDEYRAAMEKERRVLLRMQIERAGPKS
ncbi:MAG: PPOX class F420-dependent oxidoreductase [Chloroflexota bacterium]